MTQNPAITLSPESLDRLFRAATARRPRMKPTKRWLWLAAPLALACAAASAQTTQEIQTRAWAASCAACHGTNGKSNSAIPSITGQDKATLLTKLLAYKRDQLPATVMHQHAKGYTDPELERLADHFSRQPK